MRQISVTCLSTHKAYPSENAMDRDNVIHYYTYIIMIIMLYRNIRLHRINTVHSYCSGTMYYRTTIL